MSLVYDILALNSNRRGIYLELCSDYRLKQLGSFTHPKSSLLPLSLLFSFLASPFPLPLLPFFTSSLPPSLLSPSFHTVEALLTEEIRHEGHQPPQSHSLAAPLLKDLCFSKADLREPELLISELL